MIGTGIAGAAVAAGVCIAVLPYFLSTALGTRAVAALASHVLPGQVEVAQVRLGWSQPGLLRGVRLHEGRDPDSRVLLDSGTITTTSPLLGVITGRPSTVVVSGPRGDASLDDSTGRLRVVEYLESAGILDDSSSSSSKGGGGSSSGSGSSSGTGARANRGVQPMRRSSATASESGSDTEHVAVAGPLSAMTQALQSSTSAARQRDDAQAASLLQQLAVADNEAEWSADAQLGALRVVVSDGKLDMPLAFREVLGRHAHVSAYVGSEAVQHAADELDLDASWADQPPAGLPPGQQQRAQPALLQLHSDHVTGEARGWKLDSSELLLQQPAEVAVQLTPEFARLGLGSINPLLQNVVSLEEGGEVHATLTPASMQLPYTRATWHVAPMRLKMRCGPLVADLMKLVGASDVAKHGGALSTQTTAIDCDVSTADGTYTTRRVDMLIGSPRRGVHFALWGTTSSSDGVRMTLGVPADTLRQLGIQGLPEDFVLPLALTSGDASPSPQVDWVAAARKLTALSTLQLYKSGAAASSGTEQQPASWKAAILSSAKQAVSGASSKYMAKLDRQLTAEQADVPPLAAPLPWAQDM